MNRFVSLSVCGMLLVMSTVTFAQEDQPQNEPVQTPTAQKETPSETFRRPLSKRVSTIYGGSAFDGNLEHYWSFNGIHYDKPDGCGDLTQAMKILYFLSPNHRNNEFDSSSIVARCFSSARHALKNLATKELWRTQWNTEIPDIERQPSHMTDLEWDEQDTLVQHPPFLEIRGVDSKSLIQSDAARSKLAPHLKSGLQTLQGGCYYARNEKVRTIYLIALYEFDTTKAPVYSCELRYVFMGKVDITDEQGNAIYNVKPTGSIFTFLPGNILSGYYNLKDGKVLGSQMSWYPNGQYQMQGFVHETGTLEGNFRLTELCEFEGVHDSSVYYTVKEPSTCFYASQKNPDPLHPCIFETETQNIDPNDVWVPIVELFEYTKQASYQPPFLRKYRIAWPVETESASIVSDVVESATELE